jgi:hypothetical protein
MRTCVHLEYGAVSHMATVQQLADTCYGAQSWWQWFCTSITLCLFWNTKCHKTSVQFWQCIQTTDTWSVAEKNVFCPKGSINMLCYSLVCKEVHGSAVCHKIFLADWRCTSDSWQAMEQLPSIASLTGATACHCWFIYLFSDFDVRHLHCVITN